MAEKHIWNVTVEIDGVRRVFPNPNGGSSLTYFESEGTLLEILMKAKNYMLNTSKKNEKQNKMERNMGESS